MNAALVSVVIPTFNRGHCITACINSVLAQTMDDFEILVIDDFSNDDTAARVAAFADPRVSYLPQTSNRGGAVARNVGIRRARGEFVAFLDSDDLWLPEKLERQIDGMRAAGSKCGLSYTWLRCVDDNGAQAMRIHPDIDGDCFERILVSNFIGSFSNLVVRRALLVEEGGLDEDFRSCQDWDLLIRLCRHARVHCQREYLVLYLQSITDKVRISTNPRSVVQGHRRILTKYRAEYACLPAPARRRAYEVFMALFAGCGSVGDALSVGVKRFDSGAGLAELGRCVHLIARALRRKLTQQLAGRRAA
jgi:glycosyltransferase involved in cell wall biosynthesis